MRRRTGSPTGRRTGLCARWRACRSDDRGVSSLEFVGLLPLLLLVGCAALQLGIVGYAVQQAGTGARAAARAASQEDLADGAQATGRAAMSGWTAGRSDIAVDPCGEETKATVTVDIPSLIPGIGGLGSASRSATMPCD
ncbi:TadE/TadG family type IV pilus assembly protein [Streptomyces sp. ODS28]|uniref:TadE/TadG family type IV pilus assembly protein n=1 Tax=Streptomyces sp. ODS28 TaxID=3136688 RepID=UPI0031EB898B